MGAEEHVVYGRGRGVEVNVHTFSNGSDAISTGVSIPVEIIRRITAT